MKAWMLWHGGSSYSVGTVRDDTEEYESLRAAVEVFRTRRYGGDPYTPCVDDTASAWVWFGDPREERDPYPDRIISIGPRGGIVVSRA